MDIHMDVQCVHASRFLSPSARRECAAACSGAVLVMLGCTIDVVHVTLSDPQPTEPEPQPTRGFECKTPFSRFNATTRQRLDSCIPAEGGVFDNIRTATGGRYTHKQKCIEECYKP